LRHSYAGFFTSAAALLHEVQCVVSDYRSDPVSEACQQFFDSEDARTCKECGKVMPRPQAA
jgi:3-hydroxyanthranilate 3,4-dioxygenase